MTAPQSPTQPLVGPDDYEYEEALRKARMGTMTGVETPVDPYQRLGEAAFGDNAITQALRNARTRNILSGETPGISAEAAGGLSRGAMLGGTMVAGGAMAGLPLGLRVAAQIALWGGWDLAERMTGPDAQPLAEALPGAAVSGGLAGGAEALAGPAGKAFGKVAGWARTSSIKAWEAQQKARGITPTPRVRLGGSRAPFVPQLSEGAQAAAETAEQLGVAIMPGNLTQNWMVDTAQGIARVAVVPGAAGKVAAVEQATSAITRDAFDRTLARFPKMPREQVMGTVRGLVLGDIKEVKGVAQGLYREVDDRLAAQYVTRVEKITKQVDTGLVDERGRPLFRAVTENITHQDLVNGVDIRPIQDEVEALIKRSMGSPEGGILPLSPRIKDILNKPGVVPYEQAQQIRSDLFDLTKQFDIGEGAITTREKRDAINLTRILTKQIDEGVRRADPGVRPLLEEANSLWRREVKGELTDKFIQKIANEAPEDLLDAGLVGNNVADMRRLRKIIERQEGPNGPAWQKVQGMLMHRVVHNSSSAVVLPGGQIVNRLDPNKFLENLRDLGGIDDALMREMFPNQSSRQIVNDLTSYANVLKFNETPPRAAQSLSVFFNLMQAGAIGNAAYALRYSDDPTSAVGGAGMVLLGPAALTKVLTDPRMRRWLTVGAASTPGSRTAGRAILVILGGLVADKLLGPEEERKAAEAIKQTQERLGIKGSTSGSGIKLSDEELSRVRGAVPGRVEVLRKQVQDKQRR